MPREATKRESSLGKSDTNRFDFKERVDRHGNPFRDRVSTKQMRIPPPVNTAKAADGQIQTWRQKPPQGGVQISSSPQYYQQRQSTNRSSQRGKDLFPQRSQGMWRQIQSSEQGGNQKETTTQQEPAPEETTMKGKGISFSTDHSIPTIEEVMEDLHQVTRQYLSCPDPVEAAARRQRVFQGDANMQMEEATEAIIASETRRRAALMLSRTTYSNPNTPPPVQEYPLNAHLLPGQTGVHSPQTEKEEDIDGDPRCSDVDFTLLKRADEPAKLKSIIFSPEPGVDTEEPHLPIQDVLPQTEIEETLLETSKEKEDPSNPKLTRKNQNCQRRLLKRT
ncbi:hypothetical protein Bca4012_004986 [Brassica carinata]